MQRHPGQLEDSIMCTAVRELRPVCHRVRTGRATLIAVTLTAALSGNASADSYLEALGGDGGAPFAARCPAGQLLAGFELRAADDVDAIRPLCVTASGPRETSAASESVWHGGTGGAPAYVICPRYTPIVIGMFVRAEGADTVVVNNIHLFCGFAVDTAQSSDAPAAFFDAPTYQRSDGLFVPFSAEDTRSEHCPSGQVAVGMNGRSGRWLDAMGLICAEPRMYASVKSLGRVNAGAPAPQRPAGWTICDSAREARARNSPAAPNLEAQCAKLPAKVLGRVHASAPAPQHPPGWTICDSARDARARNSPAAPNLEAQCRASGGTP